ncbi:MAG: hypothetical protein ACI9WU_000435 [Myxococcota bacterium]|jgi:hypothetical protein
MADSLDPGLSRTLIVDGRINWDTHAGNDQQGAFYSDLFLALDNTATTLAGRPGAKAGHTLLDETVVVAMSEMARTPLLNGAEGKDDWPVTRAVRFAGRPTTCGWHGRWTLRPAWRAVRGRSCIQRLSTRVCSSCWASTRPPTFSGSARCEACMLERLAILALLGATIVLGCGTDDSPARDGASADAGVSTPDAIVADSMGTDSSRSDSNVADTSVGEPDVAPAAPDIAPIEGLISGRPCPPDNVTTYQNTGDRFW